ASFRIEELQLDPSTCRFQLKWRAAAIQRTPTLCIAASGYVDLQRKSGVGFDSFFAACLDDGFDIRGEIAGQIHNDVAGTGRELRCPSKTNRSGRAGSARIGSNPGRNRAAARCRLNGTCDASKANASLV